MMSSQKSNPLALIFALLLTFSVALNIVLGFNLYQAFEKTSQIVSPIFNLDDSSATYTVEKSDLGYYSIGYQRGSQTDGALIGSSQVPLEEFVGREVNVIGEFRKVLGSPMCHTKCEGTFRAPVVDIRDLILED